MVRGEDEAARRYVLHAVDARPEEEMDEWDEDDAREPVQDRDTDRRARRRQNGYFTQSWLSRMPHCGLYW